jgi:hypothetical protein
MKESTSKFIRPTPVEPEVPATPSRPMATATVGPARPRGGGSLHTVELVLELSGAKKTNLEQTMEIAQRALAGFAPAEGATDRRTFQALSSSRRGAGGAVDTRIVGVEGKAMWPDRPARELLEQLCTVLGESGYRVVVKERRECSEKGCTSDAMADWSKPGEVPSSWFTSNICGKHSFKQCAKCKSVYRLSCDNAAGQSPSVHCEVCANVLIEWGSSKRWYAELVSRGEPSPA